MQNVPCPFDVELSAGVAADDRHMSVRLVVSGAIDCATEFGFGRALARVAADVELELDLCACSYLSARGLGRIVTARKRRAARLVVLARAGSLVARIIDVCGVTDYLALGLRAQRRGVSRAEMQWEQGDDPRAELVRSTRRRDRHRAGDGRSTARSGGLADAVASVSGLRQQ